MKAISLWQPWATAIALGVKRVETRSWSTNYTGPLAIHAAKHWTKAEKEFAGVEHALGRLPARLPFGAIVATCTLIGCRFTEDVERQVSAIERIYGNYSAGRFAWFLDNIIALPEPIPFKGAQGFFNVPDDIVGGTTTPAPNRDLFQP